MNQFIKKLIPLCALVCVSIQGAGVQNGCSSDYIIVGLGTSGAILARYLSDNNGVVVFEAGENLSNDPTVLSGSLVTAFSMWNDPKYSLNTPATYGQINAGIISAPYSIGRMWGGSSAHNGLITIRGSTDTWDDYASVSGNPQWAYSNILPVMLFLEQYTPNGSTANPLQRGLNGPWYITQDAPVADINSSPFGIAYAGVLGVPLVVDYNDPTNAGANPAPNYLNVGVSINQSSVTPGANPVRSFSVNAFLPDTIVDSNGNGVNGRKLKIVSSATVSRVLFSGTKAIGVEYILDGNREQVFQAFANKGVILCASSIYSPAILQRSGVGDPALLTPLGIPVVINNPLVGTQVQNHFGPVALVRTPEDAANPFVLGESFFGISSPTIREIQVFFQRGTLLFPSSELARELGVVPGLFDNVVTIPFQQVKSNSRGNIQIVSTDPLTSPRINQAFYEPTPAVPNNDDPTVPGTDAHTAVQCLRKIEAFNSIPGYSVVYPTPADYAGTDQELYNNIVLNTFLVQDHICCTCTMGTSISDGVVDGNCNVFGAQNLMVVDCSVLTRVLTGNTQYAPYVFALRIAKNLGASLPFA